MELSEAVKGKIENYVNQNKVVLFMKGTRHQPQCGFSATTVSILDALVPDYVTVNVLEDPAIREGIKAYSDWPKWGVKPIGRPGEAHLARDCQSDTPSIHCGLEPH